MIHSTSHKLLRQSFTLLPTYYLVKKSSCRMHLRTQTQTHTLSRFHTHTRTHTHIHTHGHTHTQTKRHTDTQAHRHTDTHPVTRDEVLVQNAHGEAGARDANCVAVE